MDTKICKTCEQEKDTNDFPHHRAVCIRCASKERIEWGRRNREKTRAALKRYRKNHPETIRKYNRQVRAKALELVGKGIVACKCGCDKPELLEINHINGGGAKEMREQTVSRCKHYNNQMFYQDIVQGRRAIDDLELLCKPCNGIHYLELKYGPLPYEIKWKSNEQSPTNC